MDSQNVTTHLLSQSSYWRLSKILVEKLGLRKAFILTELISKSEYLISINQAQDGWFFYKREDMKEILQLGFTHQRTILEEFKQLGFIEMRLEKGTLSAKNYYKIQAYNIEKFIHDSLIENLKKNEIQ
jgi:hypothetical protein